MQSDSGYLIFIIVQNGPVSVIVDRNSKFRTQNGIRTVLKREYIFISNRKDIVHMCTHVRTYYYHFTPLAPGPVRIVYRRPFTLLNDVLFLISQKFGHHEIYQAYRVFYSSCSPTLILPPPSSLPSPYLKRKKATDAALSILLTDCMTVFIAQQ